jgi:transposase InsO family protein
MNAHLERFNRTIQDEFVDYHIRDLLLVSDFNHKLMDWLIWYNTRRVHHAFKNKLSPLQFMMMKQEEMSDSSLSVLTGNSRIGWAYTFY